MILKQNLFTITQTERKAVENGYYRHRQHVVLKDGRLVLEDYPTSYTGSSLQRFRFVDEKVIKESQKQFCTENNVRLIVSEFSPNNGKYIDFPKAKKYDEKEIEHTFSNRSKIKIANKITAWTRANKANKGKTLYNFITLTLTSTQIGTDKDFTKMQNTFLTYLRKYFNVKNYLYVLERQTKNTNNIHSHIIVDQYLPYARLNRVWCKILSDNGYTFPSHNYVTGETNIVSVSKALQNYDSSRRYDGQKQYINPKTNKYVKPTKEVNMPNPVDVETIYNIQAISRYVTKYITKNDSKINTSLWNCSQSISRLWTGAIINPLLYFSNLSSHVARVVTKTLDNGNVLDVCLLTHYTKIQEKIFKINHSLIC